MTITSNRFETYYYIYDPVVNIGMVQNRSCHIKDLWKQIYAILRKKKKTFQQYLLYIRKENVKYFVYKSYLQPSEKRKEKERKRKKEVWAEKKKVEQIIERRYDPLYILTLYIFTKWKIHECLWKTLARIVIYI